MARKMNKTSAIVEESVTENTEEKEEFVTENTEEKIEKTFEQKKKREFTDRDYIPCHSVIAGGLTITCRNGNYYQFKDYGADADIEYRDLVELVRKRSDHIFEPRIIIDDEDFIDEFPQLKKTYEEMYTDGDLKEILTYPADQLRNIISQLPEGAVNNLRSIAATMVGNGEIDSVRTIRTLTDIFGADFNLLSELFSNN